MDNEYEETAALSRQIWWFYGVGRDIGNEGIRIPI